MKLRFLYVIMLVFTTKLCVLFLCDANKCNLCVLKIKIIRIITARINNFLSIFTVVCKLKMTDVVSLHDSHKEVINDLICYVLMLSSVSDMGLSFGGAMKGAGS